MTSMRLLNTIRKYLLLTLDLYQFRISDYCLMLEAMVEGFVTMLKEEKKMQGKFQILHFSFVMLLEVS